MDIYNLQRKNIQNLQPYSTARSEFTGEASIYLDANENSFGSPIQEDYSRYPDPFQQTLKQKITEIKGVPADHIFLGNGSDEAIDLLIRAFCEPAEDEIILLPPTYGMYKVAANIHQVVVKEIPLLPNFQLDLEKIAECINERTKLIFVCSPNNPTGNSINRSDLETILANFKGLVVVDEAYINFARQRSFIQELTEYPNLVVLQTFSKAWGLAGVRLGMAFSSKPVIDILNKIKLPYNVSIPTQEIALKAIQNIETVNKHIQEVVKERSILAEQLENLSIVLKCYPSDANFLLVKVKNASEVYKKLIHNGIIVRDRSNIILCEDCLRITVGSPQENKALINTLLNIIND